MHIVWKNKNAAGGLMQKPDERFSLAAFARSLQLPQDYVKGNTILEMQGSEYLCIENFKGICSYTKEEIRLLTRQNKICITGSNLRIDCYTRDEIEISGCICKIEYS